MYNETQQLLDRISELEDDLANEMLENGKLMDSNAQLELVVYELEEKLEKMSGSPQGDIIINVENIKQLEAISDFLHTEIFPDYVSQKRNIIKI